MRFCDPMNRWLRNFFLIQPRHLKTFGSSVALSFELIFIVAKDIGFLILNRHGLKLLLNIKFFYAFEQSGSVLLTSFTLLLSYLKVFIWSSFSKHSKLVIANTTSLV